MRIALKLFFTTLLNFLFFVSSIYCQESIYIPSSSNDSYKPEQIISSNRFFGIEADCAAMFASGNTVIKEVGTEKPLEWYLYSQQTLDVKKNPNWKSMTFKYIVMPSLLKVTKKGDALNLNLAYFPSTTKEEITFEAYNRGLHLKDPKDLSFWDKHILGGNSIVSDSRFTSTNIPSLTLSGFFYQFTFNKPNAKAEKSESSPDETKAFEALCKKFQIPFVKGVDPVSTPVPVKGLIKLHIVPPSKKVPSHWSYRGYVSDINKEFQEQELDSFEDMLGNYVNTHDKLFYDVNEKLEKELEYDIENYDYEPSDEEEYYLSPFEDGLLYVEYVKEPSKIQDFETRYIVPTNAQNIQKLFAALKIKVSFNPEALNINPFETENSSDSTDDDWNDDNNNNNNNNDDDSKVLEETRIKIFNILGIDRKKYDIVN